MVLSFSYPMKNDPENASTLQGRSAGVDPLRSMIQGLRCCYEICSMAKRNSNKKLPHSQAPASPCGRPELLRSQFLSRSSLPTLLDEAPAQLL